MEKDRIVRINDNLKKEIAIYVQNSDLRSQCGFFSVNYVDTSRDLSQAKVYFSTIQAPLNEKELATFLNENSWKIRKALSNLLPIKRVPTLKFYYDDHLEKVRNLDDLINDI